MKLGLWLSPGNPAARRHTFLLRSHSLSRTSPYPINQPYNSCLPTSVGTTTNLHPATSAHQPNLLVVCPPTPLIMQIPRIKSTIILVTTDATLHQNVLNLFITPRRTNVLDKCMFCIHYNMLQRRVVVCMCTDKSLYSGFVYTSPTQTWPATKWRDDPRRKSWCVTPMRETLLNISARDVICTAICNRRRGWR